MSLHLDSSIDCLSSDCTWDSSPGITFLCNNSSINRRATFLSSGAVDTNLKESHLGYLVSLKVQNKVANIEMISFVSLCAQESEVMCTKVTLSNKKKL